MAKLPPSRIISMSPDEWIKVPDNLLQRDTVKHATKNSKPGGHLSVPHIVHGQMAMAETETGKRWKLDGHSRAWLAEQGLLTLPAKLTVQVFRVKNSQEACDFYRTYDNSAATENARDRLFGSFRIHRFSPFHGYLFNNTGLLSGVKYAAEVTTENAGEVRIMPTDELIKPWIKSLKLLDTSADFTDHTMFRGPIMLAMIMSVRAFGSESISFWQSFHDSGGSKSSKTCDGIFQASTIASIMRHECERKSGRRIMAVYTPYLLHAYINWQNGKRMKPWASIMGRRVPEDVITIRDWWELHIGQPDHKHLIQQPELDLE